MTRNEFFLMLAFVVVASVEVAVATGNSIAYFAFGIVSPAWDHIARLLFGAESALILALMAVIGRERSRKP